jgi:LCP family protein required for cell wall assembly
MPDGRHSAPGGPSDRSEEARKRALANEQRLKALGEAVDRHSGVERRQRGHLQRRGHRRAWIISGVVIVGLLAVLLGGGYLYAQWRFSQIPKQHVTGITYPEPNQPFNILSIGSDSRAGLTGQVAKQTGASSGSVSGQRSDVVKIVHVDPVARTITILSIPRDTTVTLLANQSLYGRFNRINVNYGNGPSLLTQTITANFGIPINHVVQVSFAGLINAADAIHGVYLDFPYKSRDPESGLNIRHPGCQLVSGFQALAVARSRHFYYSPHDTAWPKGNPTYDQILAAGWVYDGSSDFGRIDRQNAFLRAMLARVKGDLDNPVALNGFLANIPQGVTIDSTWTLNELIGLALKFHSLNPAAIKTYTLPTTAGTLGGADVLFVQQPEAQQLLVNIFGKSLLAPTNPPPNAQLQTPMPPVITPTTTTTAPAHPTTTVKGKKATAPVTTTTNPTLAVPFFDPVPCTPQ